MIGIKGLIYVYAFISCVIITKGITDYKLGKRLTERKGGVHESVWINQLKALEERVAFLELKEYDIEDFIEVDYDLYTSLKSEHDYGSKIRIGNHIFHRKPITQTNQKYYEYDIYTTRRTLGRCMELDNYKKEK